MPWWFRTIFVPLLLCFIAGFVLGLLIWLRQRQKETAKYERLRLDREAESDRLRLRISSLKDKEEQVGVMETELIELRGQGELFAAVQAKLADVQQVAGKVPDLERKVIDLRHQADEATRLEAEVVDLQQQLATIGREAPVSDDQVHHDDELDQRVSDLSAAANRSDTLEAELRSTRIDLEETRSRTGRLQAELSAALEDADRLRAVTERNAVAQASQLADQVAERPDDVDDPADQDMTDEIASAEDAADDVVTELAEVTPVGADDGDSAAPDAEETPDDDSPSDLEDAPAWQQGTTELGTPGADHRDDLKAINGIGPVMERTLNGFGIQTWEQIASFTTADIEKVSAAIKSFPGRIERDDWVAGAKELLAAGHVPGEDTSNRPLTSNRRRKT